MQNRKPESGNKSRKKEYDLEDRTFIFAKDVRAFVKKIPKTLANIEDVKQVVRASGSIGANYIEANESLSKKDFLMRIKICRKEAKECRYWLKLNRLRSRFNNADVSKRSHSGSNGVNKHIWSHCLQERVDYVNSQVSKLQVV
jgi:four helix bundle protein